MRTVLGATALVVALCVVGLALLRAFGLLDRRPGPLAVAAALGPACLLGSCVVMPVIIVLLVIGVHFGVATALIVCLVATAVAWGWTRRRDEDRPTGAPIRQRHTPAVAALTAGIGGAVGALAAIYAILGVHALAHAPTRGDDARIWTLRGLTLAFYGNLKPEIFQVQQEAGGHPLYPLYQPGMEALLSKALGSPQANGYHAMLWLIFITALWSAVYLLVKAGASRGLWNLAWLAPIAFVALEPQAVVSLAVGDADVTGAVLLGLGTLAAALWLERGDRGFLAFGAVLLTAAASTKDEDLVAAILVVLLVAVVGLLRPAGDRASAGISLPRSWRPWGERLKPVMALVAYFLILVLPWRLWCSAHHLTDAVTPPIPKALDPVYIFNRHIYFVQAFDQLVWQVRVVWGWLAALFVAVVVVCFVTRTARRLAAFYLAAVVLCVLSLLWLYTTTPLNLWKFLLPTSAFRTVDVFMIMAGLGCAHLLARLVAVPAGRRRAAAEQPRAEPVTLP